jgi:hypothetical protein
MNEVADSRDVMTSMPCRPSDSQRPLSVPSFCPAVPHRIPLVVEHWGIIKGTKSQLLSGK